MNDVSFAGNASGGGFAMDLALESVRDWGASHLTPPGTRRPKNGAAVVRGEVGSVDSSPRSPLLYNATPFYFLSRLQLA
ncbi:hypothetical protein GLAREA_08048 [Glarea lozoyensis ATCC 20868]|uniref:Uncharacterized protein n=1 Tax=Glarea lozoyensis (strain ATCC 20868 / MF5171) TaxID=1116229 RepID=S3DC12_GLAL2|nr:uncharacterized protein GLAREA_08048 [Glarea lozoyensis ATCC 20868]EPE24198.1 hypothetical protein GLAREA_08048 [Glarea lozoyensis ATCC 20868]